jgi:hypothetical protein
MVRCRSINIVILAFLLGFGGIFTPLIAYSEAGDEALLDEDFIPPKLPPPKPYRSHWVVGLLGGYGRADQANKAFSTSDQLQYQTSNFSGPVTQVGAYAVNRYAKTRAIRLYGLYQLYRFSGTATEVGVPVAAKNVEMSEAILGAGGEWLWYVWPKHTLWIGAGAEYGHGLSLDIKIDNAALPTSAQDYVNYFKLDVSAGWDIDIQRKFVLTPVARVGDILSVKPSVLVFEGLVLFGYRL